MDWAAILAIGIGLVILAVLIFLAQRDMKSRGEKIPDSDELA
jgi:hypothetical protein